MKQNKIIFLFLLVGAGVLSFFAVRALADISDLQYPVPQLGNCKNESECRSYCDQPENIAVCLDFAEQNNLMPKEELEMAKKFAAAGNKGPGGCTGKDSCEAYCNDISRIDECVSFAEQNDLIPPDELQEAKKVRDAIKRGIKPPACGSKKSCDSYCEDPSHMEECVTFASEAGLMGDKEKEDAQKMMQAMRRGVKPPPCRGRQACDEYCQQPDNMEVCMNFAIEAGFMGDKEKEDAQKMLSAIKKGVRPPNCRGRDECENYCQSDEHFEECANFAEAAGFMDAKEAEMARKTKGKGPGGCKGKEECEAFCNNPSNQDTCFKFAEENGMIPEEELSRMKEGMNRMREDIDRMQSEAKNCLRSALGEETMNKIQSGELTPGPQLGDAIQSCFQKMPPPKNMQRQEGRGPEGMQGMPPSERSEFRRGPGGCSTPEECQNFCSQNPEACQNFQRPESGQRPDEQKPMGSPGEFERRPMPMPSGLDQNQLPPFEGRMPPNEQMPPEFQRPEMMPMPSGEMIPPPGFVPPTEFESRMPMEQSQPLEPMPQIQQQFQELQGEMAPPPPPPPPSSEPAPQSLLNNKYLGAIFRFLSGN
ncbi:MAG: hypothetical protein HYT66_00350 [Candidatus Yanofskybacteria bacterium]|nr:hypothetical protein [Candidatus Yanofskybacteria bacterium]